MKVLDLFSGIGGFSLGLERAGFETVAFCEIEPFCQKVLKKNWPDVPIFDDVAELTKTKLDNAGIFPDVITAGFPCQDISLMNQWYGENDGTKGNRSGLWREVTRLVREIRPRFAIMENVTALLIRGFGDIAGELAESGYDIEWHCLSASGVGLSHVRNRCFIIAHDPSIGVQRLWPGGVQITQGMERQTLSIRDSDGQWKAEPDILRTPDGVSAGLDRVNRLKALGNAVCPQVVTLVGNRIMEAGFAN